MSQSASPKPNNMLILAGLAIGAIWLMNKQAQARTVTGGYRPGTVGGNQVNQVAGLANNLINGLGRLFGGSSSKPTNPATIPYNPNAQTAAAAAAAANADTNPDLNGSVADYGSGQNDGVAYNPPNAAPWDAMSLEASLADRQWQ